MSALIVGIAIGCGAVIGTLAIIALACCLINGRSSLSTSTDTTQSRRDR